MTASRQLVIGRRFRGPPDSGNGGYTCGMLAAAARTAVEVRLMKPPPLDRALDIRDDADSGRLLLLDGEETVASASPKTFELAVPEPPSYADALAAVRGYEGFKHHTYPGCFVCGPERGRGDGMRKAALGARIEVPGLDGPVRLRVPPGTLSGRTFRLKERGLPSARNGSRGDQVVTVHIVLPSVLDERSKALLEEFGRLHPEDVRKPREA